MRDADKIKTILEKLGDGASKREPVTLTPREALVLLISTVLDSQIWDAFELLWGEALSDAIINMARHKADADLDVLVPDWKQMLDMQ